MIDIRRLGGSDLQHFKAIRLEALEREPDAFASSADQWRALPDSDWLRRMTDHPVFVAFRDGAPVGIMGLIREAPDKRRHRATLVMVYVRASERGSGVAQGLLDAATGYARDIGVWQLDLGVNASNAVAIRFYERNGYVAFGRLPNASIIDGVVHDELLMAKRID